MDPGIGAAIEIGAKLIPALVGLVQGLIEAGHSPEEAEEIVRKDITSRRAQYEQMRDEDREALKIKHGVLDDADDS